jgi:putative nucleotidyltransferase with HDIG domain
MTSTKLDQILRQVRSFPTMPKTGANMLALLENPDTTVTEIEKVVRHDPGLTGNILKLANSAYFGMPTKVSSVRQAVILLGMKRLVQLVIASCVSAVMDVSVPGYQLPPGNLWRHSIAVSIAAEALARDSGNTAVEDVFTPALLHDIGKLILGQFVGNELETIEHIADKGIPHVVAENMVFGIDHAELGAKILEQWAFPPEVVNAVKWHHDPDGVDSVVSQIDIVYLANLLCQTNGSGGEDEGHAIELSPAVMERSGIKFGQFEEISQNVERWVDELSAALSLH